MLDHKDEHSIEKMARIMEVSRSGYYDWLKREASARDEENARIYHDLLEIFLASRCSMGARRIAKQLSKLYGRRINRKRVARLMKENGLVAKGRKKFVVTTDSKDSVNIFPNLLKRDFTAEKPNTKFVSDTTYIATEEGWLYLAAIMDLYGRKIVGMAVSEHNDKELVIAALEDAVRKIGKKKLQGCILHSDRGSTYASNEYVAKVNEYGMVGSMSRTGNCWDNAPIESFWGRMKVEWIEGQYKTREAAIQDIYEYIWGYYNTTRLHSANNYRTPSEVYKKGQVA